MYGSNSGGKVRLADYPGMIGKGCADLRDLPPKRNLNRDHLENWPVTASDLEVDPCQRYDSEGRTGGDQFETSAVADQQMNWWSLIRTDTKTAAFAPDRAQGAHEHEAKEHDLPLVRQGRA